MKTKRVCLWNCTTPKQLTDKINKWLTGVDLHDLKVWIDGNKWRASAVYSPKRRISNLFQKSKTPHKKGK